MTNVVKTDEPGCLITKEVIDDICASIPDPSGTIPVADNEADANIRTGQAGVSDDFARADHNHPIVRQANPGDPVITYSTSSGSAYSGQIITDRRSTEETFERSYRTTLRAEVGTGRNFQTIPNIAGFQRPQILPVSGYRPTTTAPQKDDSGAGVRDGAMPNGPYMAIELAHWSSTQRVYSAPFRRESVFTQYPEFILRYIRS